MAIKVPSPATRIVGKDLFLAAWVDEASSSIGSSIRAFNLRPDGPTHVPLLESGLVPSSQSAQVPSHVMIWLSPHSSERHTELSC